MDKCNHQTRANKHQTNPPSLSFMECVVHRIRIKSYDTSCMERQNNDFYCMENLTAITGFLFTLPSFKINVFPFIAIYFGYEKKHEPNAKGKLMDARLCPVFVNILTQPQTTQRRIVLWFHGLASFIHRFHVPSMQSMLSSARQWH